MIVPKKIILATRRSPLAMAQAQLVAGLLRSLRPFCEVTLLPTVTEGDQKLDSSLSKIGGKGLFIKALETALIEGHADIAVHSLKDMPTLLPAPFVIAAITARESPFDAFVSKRFAHLDELPKGAVVGTSSLRRASQLGLYRPDLTIAPLRGNLGSRLSRLDSGQFDGLILATAGLNRLKPTDRIYRDISPIIMVPAAGQGALAIEICRNRPDLAALLSPLNDPATVACVTAERAVSAALGGNCHCPLAAWARVENGRLLLTARLVDADKKLLLDVVETGHPAESEVIGQRAAHALAAQGGKAILDSPVSFDP